MRLIAAHLLTLGAGSAAVQVTTGQLAEATGLHRRTVITALGEMERGGLITRDGGQGRRARIALVDGSTCDRVAQPSADDHKLPEADDEAAAYMPVTRRRAALRQRMIDMYRTGRRFPRGWAAAGGVLLGQLAEEVLDEDGRRALALYDQQVDEGEP